MCFLIYTTFIVHAPTENKNTEYSLQVWIKKVAPAVKQKQNNHRIMNAYIQGLAFYNKYFEFNSHVDMRHRVATLCSHWATACVYVWIYICSCQHMYICMNIYTYAHMRHVLSWYSHNVELFRSILNQAVNLTESVTFMRAHNLTFLTSCWKG